MRLWEPVSYITANDSKISDWAVIPMFRTTVISLVVKNASTRRKCFVGGSHDDGKAGNRVRWMMEEGSGSILAVVLSKSTRMDGVKDHKTTIPFLTRDDMTTGG